MIYCVRFGNEDEFSSLGYYGSKKEAMKAVKKYNKEIAEHNERIKARREAEERGEDIDTLYDGYTSMDEAELWGCEPTPKTKTEVIALLNQWGDMAHG
jgi:hypothetical protein